MSDKQYMCLLVYISVNSALEMGIFKLSWPVTHTIKMDTNTHTHQHSFALNFLQTNEILMHI